MPVTVLQYLILHEERRYITRNVYYKEYGNTRQLLEAQGYLYILPVSGTGATSGGGAAAAAVAPVAPRRPCCLTDFRFPIKWESHQIQSKVIKIKKRYIYGK